VESANWSTAPTYGGSARMAGDSMARNSASMNRIACRDDARPEVVAHVTTSADPRLFLIDPPPLVGHAVEPHITRVPVEPRAHGGEPEIVMEHLPGAYGAQPLRQNSEPRAPVGGLRRIHA
jgi:hypothetical protein